MTTLHLVGFRVIDSKDGSELEPPCAAKALAEQSQKKYMDKGVAAIIERVEP